VFIIPLASDIITWNHKIKDLDPLCRFKQKVWLKHAVVPGLVEGADVFDIFSWNLGSLWFSL